MYICVCMFWKTILHFVNSSYHWDYAWFYFCLFACVFLIYLQWTLCNKEKTLNLLKQVPNTRSIYRKRSIFIEHLWCMSHFMYTIPHFIKSLQQQYKIDKKIETQRSLNFCPRSTQEPRQNLNSCLCDSKHHDFPFQMLPQTSEAFQKLLSLNCTARCGQNIFLLIGPGVSQSMFSS